MTANLKQGRRGSTLVVTMVVVATLSGLLAIALSLSSTTARMTDRSRDFAATQAATEGAVEFSYGIWSRFIATQFRPPSSVELAGALGAGPSLAGFAYLPAAESGPLQVTPTDAHGMPAAGPVAHYVDVPGYPGWRGRAYGYTASARMQTGTSGATPVTYGVKRRFQYAEVPLFQALAFFEGDLEIYKPAPMIIDGLVHANNKAWLSGHSANQLTFKGKVSYAADYSHKVAPPLAYTWDPNAGVPGTTQYNNPGTHVQSPVYPGGFDEQVTKTDRMEPLGADPATALDATDANPNNDSMRELIEPPVSGHPDPPSIAPRRLYNKAGVIVEIGAAGTTVTARNGAVLTAGETAAIKSSISAPKTIYDRREGKYLKVSTVDMSAMRAPLNTAAGFNGVLYIHDTTSLSESSPTAIRLAKGGELPAGGLTVASQNPIYIQGDYNTGATTDPNSVPSNSGGNPNNTDSSTATGYTSKPSAVIADAVTVLSNNWNDVNSDKALTSRVASHTTVNTAILSGFLPSGYKNSAGTTYGYSGGFNNFLRFLESWSSKDLTYFGSMVQLYESKILTGEWGTGNIYSPPNRRWNFDSSFMTTPPPGTPSAATLSRGAWERF